MFLPVVLEHVAPLVEPLGAHRAKELLALVVNCPLIENHSWGFKLIPIQSGGGLSNICLYKNSMTIPSGVNWYRVPPGWTQYRMDPGQSVPVYTGRDGHRILFIKNKYSSYRNMSKRKP